MDNTNNVINSNTTNNNVTNADIVKKSKKYLRDSKGAFSLFIKPISNKIKGNGNAVKGITNILDALMVRQIIDIDTYNNIKFEAINTSKPVEQLLIDNKILTLDEVFMLYSEIHNIPYVSLIDLNIDLEILNIIPKDIAEKTLSVSFYRENEIVFVATNDPLDLQKIKYLENLTGKIIRAFYTSPEQIKLVINTKYSAQINKEVEEALEDFQTSNVLNLDGYSENVLNDDVQNAPIIKIVNMILEYGISHKSSDIHIEPRESKITVRFRINGLLAEKLTIPKKLHAALVARIKILCNAKIDEHRIPQDGRFQVKVKNGYSVDIRVSIIPAIYGEKIVMRLLEKKQDIKSLKDLGMFGISLNRLENSLKKTQGIILVTGPTGSGKTQTLSSCLKILNTPEVNIVTLEDPVEIKIDGVNQVQVNPEVGLTFASGLRAFLRQDPDIIMVGEIRDSETAQLAIQAALVGRLVLATIHTNSAAGAFTRLVDMGIEPFLITSTVNLVLAQRLVRVLCTHCKEKYLADKEKIFQIKQSFDNNMPFILKDSQGSVIIEINQETERLEFFKNVGCPKCNMSGFSGRTGIFETLQMSEKIANMILNKSSISDINRQAIKEGMTTLVQDGFIKALLGITTIEEVLRVKNE